MDHLPIILAQGTARATLSIFIGLVLIGVSGFVFLTKTNWLRAQDRFLSALFTSGQICLLGFVFFGVAASFLMGYEPDKYFFGDHGAKSGASRPPPSRPTQPSQPAPSSRPAQPSKPAGTSKVAYSPVTRITPDEKTMQAANAVWRSEPRVTAVDRPAEIPRMPNLPMENIPKEPAPEDDRPLEIPQADLAEQARTQQLAAEMRARERMAKAAEVKAEPAQETDRLTALELPQPSQTLGHASYDGSSVQESPVLGHTGKDQFSDRAPAGGVMVGAIVFIGENWGKSVAGIQPIYQVGDKYVLGKLCGNATDRAIRQLAETGGVVAGFKARTGLVVDAVQFAYGPLKGAKVDSTNGYFGDSVGSDGGFPRDFYAEGNTIAGVYGTYEKGKSLTSLGMYVIPRMQVTESPAKNEIRKFTSADGKFSIEAKLLKVNADGTVSLEKADGSKMSAPIASLSEEDRAYIRANQ